MIVVDVNIIAYFLIPGEHTERVSRLRSRDPDWVAPRLWVDEFANILCTSERVGKLSQAQVMEIATDGMALMQGLEFLVPLERTLAAARASGRSGYDSQYIALAEDLDIPLFTFDKQILASRPDLARTPD